MRGRDNYGELRRCTKCSDRLPRQAFYSKGSRLDSVCKECKKKLSRTSYVARKNRDSLSNLQKFVSLACDLETTRISNSCDYLAQIIRRNSGNC